jgi:hypothetical protein
VHARLFALAITVSVLVLAVISCEQPTAPGAVPGKNPPAAVVTRLDIEGPSVVAPNTTAQYKLVSQTSDGTTHDVQTAGWSSSDAGVLSVTTSGIATARQIGESRIGANSGGLHANLEVLVLPPGTFKVAGAVREAGLPVPGATVEVVDNPATAVTDASGAYRFYGLAGDILVRVAKEGYKPQSTRLTVTANQTVDFALEAVSPAQDLRGTYGLTLTADCPAATADGRTRTYDAHVTQEGPSLTVVLGGARFATSGERGNSFTGRVAPNGITFVLSGWDDYVYSGIYYNIVEILSDNPPKLLTVSGTVFATATETGISGVLVGEIAAQRALGEYANNDGWSCSSHNHQFALLRR